MFAMAVVVVQLFSVLSHLVTFPVIPVIFNVPELAPSQTVAALLKVPPSEAGSTEIVTSFELAAEQDPDVITALY